MSLAPMADEVGGWPVHHGERGDLDPDYPTACLCGWHFYLACADYLDGGGIEGWAVWRADDGRVYADPAP